MDGYQELSVILWSPWDLTSLDVLNLPCKCTADYIKHHIDLSVLNNWSVYYLRISRNALWRGCTPAAAYFVISLTFISFLSPSILDPNNIWEPCFWHFSSGCLFRHFDICLSWNPSLSLSICHPPEPAAAAGSCCNFLSLLKLCLYLCVAA